MKKITLILLSILYVQFAQASHIAGAEIWYEHDTLNIYEVHLKLYRDCGPGSAALGSTANVQINSSTITSPITLSLDTAGTNDPNNGSVVNTCVPNNCTTPSSNMFGLEMWHYTGTVTLPNVAADWEFKFTTCCRNPNSTVSSSGTMVRTTLNNLVTPFNNGLSVPYNTPYYYSLNVNNAISFAAYESDGDSLDYQLTAARFANGICPYLNGNTPQSPFPNSVLSLNNQTGLLTFTPTVVGTYVVAIETQEYRSGVLIGSSTRDYQVTVISGATNNLPNLSGVNGTSSFVKTINACGTNAMTFTINSSDPDVGNTTDITNVITPSGASFTTNTAANQVGTFTWTPSLSDIRAQPHILVLEVQDNNCGTRQEVYQLYVNQCNPDSVWAGDANADFTCDNYDILNIGIANGTSGVIRLLATTSWQAEWCGNWTNNFVSGINYKHADCNGDGTVNSTDLAAVAANYGLVHQKTNQVGQYKTLGLPDLYCDVTSVQANKGSTVSIPIMLGTIGSEMNDFYGIAATVELLNAQTSAPIAISKNVSWIGNGTNSFDFEQNVAPNKSAFTFVRNDQQNLMNQQGQIGEISFPISANSTFGSKVIIQFSDIRMIKNDGEEITDYNVLSDTLEILGPTSINDLGQNNSITVYPNPTNGGSVLFIETSQEDNFQVQLLDMVGRVVNKNIFSGKLTSGKHELKFDMNDLAQGEYLLEIRSELGKKVIPIQKR
jgi:hypothetical protein